MNRYWEKIFSVMLFLALLCTLPCIATAEVQVSEAGKQSASENGEAPDPDAEPKPTVTKDPLDETVDAGGECVFIARHTNAIWAVWHFVSPNGEIDYRFDDPELAETFPELVVESGMYSNVVLKNIPSAMNNWRVCCEYSNNSGAVRTKFATVHVRPDPNAPPSPSPTPTPAPTPTPSPTPVPPPIQEADAGRDTDVTQEEVSDLETGKIPEGTIVLDDGTDTSPAPAIVPIQTENTRKSSSDIHLKLAVGFSLAAAVLGVAILIISKQTTTKKHRHAKRKNKG